MASQSLSPEDEKSLKNFVTGQIWRGGFGLLVGIFAGTRISSLMKERGYNGYLSNLFRMPPKVISAVSISSIGLLGCFTGLSIGYYSFLNQMKTSNTPLGHQTRSILGLSQQRNSSPSTKSNS